MATLKRDYNFFIMPDDVMDAKMTASAKTIYAVLARHADKKGTCFPSYKRIQEMTGFGKTKISNAIKELETIGWLVHERTGRSNVYTLMSRSKTSDVPSQDNRSPAMGLEGLSNEGQYKEGLDADTSVGTEAKQCLDYFFEKYKATLECTPTINGARDMAILKRLLRNYDMGAVKETMDTFFGYPRADYTLPRFQSRFDVLYLRNKRLNER